MLDVEFIECLRNSQAAEDQEIPYALFGKCSDYKSKTGGKLNPRERQSSVYNRKFDLTPM